VLRSHFKTPKTMFLSVSKKGAVTAKDITTDETVEIINPDHHIATLTEDTKFEMEMKVESGRGYVSSEKNKGEDTPVGVIAIDSLFSPVKRVNIEVENTRVGHITDYDKLILEVFTNGSMEPKDTVLYAANILQRHLDVFLSIGKLPEEIEEEEEDTKEKKDLVKKFSKPISELELLKSKINEDTFLIYTPVWGRLVRTIRRNEKFINRGMEYRFDTKAEVYEFSKPLRKGEAFFNLDFKLPKADKTRRRKFYHENAELPDERVQSVNHFEIFCYFNNFLADCFIDKDQVLQAYSPLPDDMPLFIFRIDTDFADFNRIKALFILCEHYNISATWFVDVHSKEILDYYGSFRNQEIALHCDRHYLYKDAASNRANIKSGMDILMKQVILLE